MYSEIIWTCATILIFQTGWSSAQVDCTGLEDGSYGHGCASYTRCEDGKGTIIDCQHPGFAYDHRTGKCEPWTTVPPPCGSIDNDCADRDDGRYAVMPDCMYYYTCQAHAFSGTNPCNIDPDHGDLRFDYDLQLCNWVWDVAPPCGTFIAPTTELPKSTAGQPEFTNIYVDN